MWTWIKNNPSTIVIAALLIAALVAIAIKLRKDKKQGKSTCGGNCQACGMCARYKANAANAANATASTSNANATANASNSSESAEANDRHDAPTNNQSNA